MKVERLAVGEAQANCYIVSEEESGKCALIDPGAEEERILQALEDGKLHCEAIFLTHCHRDHTGAAAAISAKTGAPVYINKKDSDLNEHAPHKVYPLPENYRLLSDGDTVPVGKLEFKVLETPGHTPGGITLICGNALFTGDTLFKGKCGKTILPGGSMRFELKSIHRIAHLPGDYTLYPGHMEPSTLEYERKFNMFVLEALDMYD